jgi:flagellar basal-body rod protein FlgB
MGVDGLFNSTIAILGKAIDLRAKSHTHIAGNLANAETPGYVPTTLMFERQLQDAVKGHGKQGGTPALTNPRHIPLKGASDSLAGVRGTVLETPANSIGRDGNAVELENEMGKMVENQLMYTASVQILGRKFDELKYAIKGG